jgi:hypothetical protein
LTQFASYTLAVLPVFLLTLFRWKSKLGRMKSVLVWTSTIEFEFFTSTARSYTNTSCASSVSTGKEYWCYNEKVSLSKTIFLRGVSKPVHRIFSF